MDRRAVSGPGKITNVELLSGNAVIAIQDGNRISFDPHAAGYHQVRYTVDGKYTATLSVDIRNFLADDRLVADQNSPASSLDVLANDFRPDPNYYYVKFRPEDYTGPRQLTGVTQSAHGGTVAIAVDGKTVTYTPAADFVGEDTFTYTVDGLMTATATVTVIRRVHDDAFRVDAGDGPQALPVLVNDLFGTDYTGPGQITSVSGTAHRGTVSISDHGNKITYTPADGFSGTDTFTYTVDGTQKAEVRVVVNAPAGNNQKFGSLTDFAQFLIDGGLERYANLFGQPQWRWYAEDAFYASGSVATNSVVKHSETNVQVAGVDEADIVEFDSDYIYMLVDGQLVVVDALPAESMNVVSRFNFEGRAVAEFLHGDRLTIISEVGGYSSPFTNVIGDVWFGGSYGYQATSTVVTVLDVSDRSAPTVVQKTRMDGRYVDSRGVGDFVYVLVSNTNASAPMPLLLDADDDLLTPPVYETREQYIARLQANAQAIVDAALPHYTTYGPDGEQVGTGLLDNPEDIYRPLTPNAWNLTSVVSFNVASDVPGLTDSSAIFGTGASTVYASLNNFYVFDTTYDSADGAITRITKFDWEPTTGSVDFVASTTVAGRMVNQFSADENGEYLRIATTVSNFNSGNWSGRSENLLFVLREDDGVFELVSSLKNLAVDETIQSVRFMGDRAFVTTFREVDPLFAIDLSDPTNPQAVGHITLPGFATYMQLIEKTHLLTIGRNTPAGASGPTQVSLFDISDLHAPRRIAEYTFERFSTSEAELDHHAFGYYADLGLLAMPVSRSYVERVDRDGDGYSETWQTVLENELAIFSIDVDAVTPAERLALAGQIEHNSPVRRSGFIGDKLYSIASGGIKVVDVSAPDAVIAELEISSPLAPINPLPVEPFEIFGIKTSVPQGGLKVSNNLLALYSPTATDVSSPLTLLQNTATPQQNDNRLKALELAFIGMENSPQSRFSPAADLELESTDSTAHEGVFERLTLADRELSGLQQR